MVALYQQQATSISAPSTSFVQSNVKSHFEGKRWRVSFEQPERNVWEGEKTARGGEHCERWR